MDLSIDFSKIKETLSAKLKELTEGKKGKINPPDTVVAIDVRRSAFHYYTKLGDDKNSVIHRVKNYAGLPFDESFYTKLKEALDDFTRDEPTDQIRRVAVILPDEAVAIDNIRLPALKTMRLVNNALSVKISEIYSNSEELKTLTN